MKPLGPQAIAVAALLLGLCRSELAHAQAPRVFLVRPPDAAPEVQLALIRVEGELTADGFDVVRAEAQSGASSAVSMLQAENANTSTTVGLFLNADGTSAQLWVVDKLTDKTVVRRLATRGQPENALPEVLAVRAVELLRASLLELVVERNNRAAAPRAVERATEWAARPLQEAPLWFGIETGAAVLWNPAQVEAAFVSVVRGRLALSELLQTRVSFIGLGTRPRVQGTGGSAAISQWGGLGELLLTPFQAHALRPSLSLGVGAFHTSVMGDAVWPYQGVRSSQWSLAGDAGAGLSWLFGKRLELAAEVHTLWLAPEPIVQFVADDGAHLGRPAMIGSLSLLGWL